MKSNTTYAMFALLLILASSTSGQVPQQSSPRERLLMDFGWRFALGHSYDTRRDFNNGSGYFSYFAKTGYGDGAASADFDDRGWRQLDVPHDWCAELPFDQRGGFSHGYKAIGRNFPENSVGWYRKSFMIPGSDLGKRISLSNSTAYFAIPSSGSTASTSVPSTAGTPGSAMIFPIISITVVRMLSPCALTRQWRKAGSMKGRACTGMCGSQKLSPRACRQRRHIHYD
jgi:hypothetical protein